MRGNINMLINRPSVHICGKMLVILVLGGEDDMFVVDSLPLKIPFAKKNSEVVYMRKTITTVIII